MTKITAPTTEDTISVGYRIGEVVTPGSVIALEGTLGAGKTTIVKGIARALDILEPVTSPTYTIISEYEGRLPLYHIDLYRLSSVDEAELLGAEEYLFGDGVCVIEWSEKIRELFPENYIRVHIIIECTDGTRSIEIEGLEL